VGTAHQFLRKELPTIEAIAVKQELGKIKGVPKQELGNERNN
jgi:hypothetical protein